MSLVTYSMGVSLDGYITGPDGTFDWGLPTEEIFQVSVGEVRAAGAYILGRRLYESMLYWEPVDQSPALEFSTVEFAQIWRALPKVVFSNTLDKVMGNARLATGNLAEEIARLKAEVGDREIGLGGATLAAEAARLDLIDEYRMRVFPILLGGGLPYFPREQRRADLQLIENRTLSSRVLYLRYRVNRTS